MTTLTTDRLVLRPPATSDAAALVRGLNDFEVSRWLARVPYPYGPEDAQWFLDDTRNAGLEVARFVITHRGALIGIVSVEAGELGYWLDRAAWGRGFGREAARAATDHGFAAIGLERMTAGYFTGNEGSRRILEGLGFAEVERGTRFSRAQATQVPHVALVLEKPDWARERRR